MFRVQRGGGTGTSGGKGLSNMVLDDFFQFLGEDSSWDYHLKPQAPRARNIRRQQENTMTEQPRVTFNRYCGVVLRKHATI